MKEHDTEVLVVGAGPVGLLTANLLADDGIRVRIMDRAECVASRSYACALHPRTMKLLARLGLAPALLRRGRAVPMVAFYEGKTRRAEIDLAALGGEFPFLLIVPQGDLEAALEERLKQKSDLEVMWNHRCAGVRWNNGGASTTIEKLGGTGTGYIVPHWENVVLKRFPFHARYLVGADGHNSMIRESLGIGYERAAEPETYAAVEFETDEEPENELRIVLDEETSNALWPLPGARRRWTFQLPHPDADDEFPTKVRTRVRVADIDQDQEFRHWVGDICHDRAPWFSENLKEIEWFTQVTFQHRLASEFGRASCWLVGDAAHQTGPIGAQSMNAGLVEAEELATCLRRILREGAGPELLDAYSRERRREWRQLLGLAGGLVACGETGSWVNARAQRILPCLPSSGDDLTTLVNQLRLTPA